MYKRSFARRPGPSQCQEAEGWNAGEVLEDVTNLLGGAEELQPLVASLQLGPSLTRLRSCREF